MATVTLKPITSENWRECIRLEVAEGQENWVAPNVQSLAESAFEPDAGLVPLGVYDGDTMVGFVMYGYPRYQGRNIWAIFRLMVDKSHQGNGYGRATMEQVIQKISAQPDCTEIYISYQPDNTIAAKLYASMGFLNEGEMVDDEILVRLPVQKG
jgi:diamine N-acetyltransferase